MGGGRLLVLERRRMWSLWFGHREVRRARGGEGGGYVGLSVYIYINIKIISLLCAGLRVLVGGGRGKGKG